MTAQSTAAQSTAAQSTAAQNTAAQSAAAQMLPRAATPMTAEKAAATEPARKKTVRKASSATGKSPTDKPVSEKPAKAKKPVKPAAAPETGALTSPTPVDDGVFPWEISALFETIAMEGGDVETEENDYESNDGKSVNPFQSPLRLWALKTGAIKRNLRKNPYWAALRHAAAQAAAREAGLDLDETKRTFVHPRTASLIAPVEFMLSEDGGATWGPLVVIAVPEEAKAEWEAHASDGTAPSAAFMSLQHNMEAGDCDMGWILASCGAKTGYLIRIERDREIGAMIEQTVASFWDTVVEKRPPLSDEDADRALITKIIGLTAKADETVDLRGDNRILDLIERKEALGVEARKIAAEISDISAEITLKMKDHMRGQIDDAREIYWVRSRGGEVTYSKGPSAYIRTRKIKT